MDKKYQDIHVIIGNQEFIYRCVTIKKMSFGENFIHASFMEREEEKSVLIPKVRGMKITID